MPHALLRKLTHDWPVIVLVSANLLGIGLYLGVGPAPQAGVSWRAIDTAAVRRLLDAGGLSGREADWYHPARPGEGGGGH